MIASVVGSWVYYAWGNNVCGVFFVGSALLLLSLPVFLVCLSTAMNQKFYRLYTLQHLAAKK